MTRRAAARATVAALLAAGLVSLLVPAFALAAETDTFRLEPWPDRVQGESRRVFAYDLAPDATVRDAVKLTNLTSEEQRFRVYGADALEDQDGGAIEVLPSTAPRRGVGSWIDLGATEVVLGARESQVIDLEVSRPGDATATGFGAVVAEQLHDASAEGGIEVVFRLAIVVRVDGEVPGLAVERPRLDLPLTLIPSRGDLTTTVRNETLRPVTAEVHFGVDSLTGRSWLLEPVTVDLVAGEEREVTATWDTVPRWGGALTPSVAVVWAGGDTVREGSRVWYPPIWLVALLVVVTAVRVARRWWSTRAAMSDVTAPPATVAVEALEQRLRRAAQRLHAAGSSPDPAIRHHVDAEARAVADVARGVDGAPEALVDAAAALSDFAVFLGRDTARAREAADRFDQWYSRAGDPEAGVVMTGTR